MTETKMKRMTVKASEDVYVSLTTGDAVRLAAGEEREFPEYIAYACLEAGCTEVKVPTIQEVIKKTETETKKKTTKKK